MAVVFYQIILPSVELGWHRLWQYKNLPYHLSCMISDMEKVKTFPPEFQLKISVEFLKLRQFEYPPNLDTMLLAMLGCFVAFVCLHDSLTSHRILYNSWVAENLQNTGFHKVSTILSLFNICSIACYKCMIFWKTGYIKLHTIHFCWNPSTP